MNIEYPFYGRVHELLFRTFKNDIFLGEPLGERRRDKLAFYLVFLHKILALMLLVRPLPSPAQGMSLRPIVVVFVVILIGAVDIFLLPKQRGVVKPNRTLDVVYGAIFAVSYVGFIVGLLVL